MAKTLLDQYEEWKQKKQKEEQQASQPKYTIPESGTILEKYQAYKQQRQAYEQKAISSKRINNPSHLGNVMIAGAVQNTQKKQAEAERQKKAQQEAEAVQLKQQDAQKHVETVQKLTNQYMPVRPDPIPQVDITKKYGIPSGKTAVIASAGVSDAPFNAMSEAERDRREREERDRADREAYQAALERANLGRGGKLNESSGRGGGLNLPSTGRGGALENNPANGWDYDAQKAQDIRRVEQEDELANKYQLQPTAPRQYTENETVVAAEQAKQSIAELTAERDRLRKDIETLDTVLKWPVGRQDVAGYQNFTFAQAQRPQAEKALTEVENKLKEQTKALQWAEDKATVMNLRKQYDEAEPDMKGYIGVSLKAAEFRQQFNQRTDGQKTFDVLAETISQGLRQAGQDYLNISKPILRLFGLPESAISKDNQKAMEESARVMEMQVQNSSEFVGYAQQVVSSAVRMVPTVALSLLSGGTSTAVQAASGIQLAGAGLGANVLNATKELVKSPQFINMWATAFGNYYTEEESKGKNPLIASIGAGIKATVNAMIEMGGGIQTAAAKPTGWQTLKETVFEEAGEEVKQGIADRAYDYSQSGNVQSTKPEDIVSWDNPDAVISGKQMIEEGLLGGSVAALMGGVQQGALMAINGPNADYQERSEYNYPEANIDKQIASKEAEIAKLESDAREAADRERMETNLRDTQAETKYNELVQLVTETFPEESATVQKITEATPITIKRMEEIATGAIGEFTELMRSNPELTEKADAMKQAIVGLFGGIRDSGARNVERAREYGQAGIRLDDIVSEIGEDNVNDTLRQAYDEGRQAAIQRAEEQESAIKEAGPQQGRKGILRSISPQEADKNGVEPITKLTKTIRAATNALRGFAEDTGINVVLFESPVNDLGEHTGKDGWYNRNTQTVYLDVKSGYGNEEAMMRTAGHEITHFIKQYAPKYYETIYKQNVIKALYDQDPGALQRMVKDQIRKAAENGKTQTLVQAMDEVIADTSQTMLFGGEATIKKLVSDNPKLFVRVKRWIDNFVKSIRKAIHNIGPDSEGAKILSKSYDTFKEIQSNYWKAMQEASVNLRGELQAEEMSAYEEAHEKAQAAKNAKIGTSVTVPGANQYTRPENPINEAMPDAIESRDSEDVPDFGAMFADAVDENAVQNMTDEEAQELLNLPNANKLAQEGEKSAAKPDFGAMFEASINEDAVANAPQEALDIVSGLKLPGNKPASKPAPAKTPLSELMAIKRYSRKFKNLAKKWAANEWVNIDLNKDSQDGYDFLKFASKWYNGGKENLPYPELRVDPMFKEGGMRNTLTYDDHDADYPNFLIDVFYKAGKAEAPDIKTSPKGEKENAGEEVSKQGTVTGSAAELSEGRESEASGSVSVDGAWAAPGRILENVSSQDVQPDGDRGNVAQDAAEPGAEVIRPDASTDAQRPGREPGVGTGQRGDIQPEAGERAGRNNDGLTEDSSEAVTAASDAVEEAQQEIVVSAQSGQNYIIPAEGLNLPSGKKARFGANINAIKVAKQLEEEARIATPEEQEILSRYVGWGGIADAFDERPGVRSEWGKEYDELKALLTEDEYKAARASTKNAHYTSIDVIRAMYSALNQWGFKGGYILEPSVGVGNFIGSAPAFQRQSKWAAVELDHITSLIAKHLYPQARVHNMGFQEAQFPDNYFDLAIGNVPFGNYGVADKTYPNYLTKSIHNYFFAKSVDKVRPGGLILFITSKYTMDSDSEGVREYLQTKADLLGAIRLPDSAFKDNADTSVVTDILVLKKRAAGTPYGGEAFTTTHRKYVNNPYNSYNSLLHTQNEYFVNHPEMVLGEAVPVRGMYGQEIGYKKKGDLPLDQQVTAALLTIPFKMEYPSRSSMDPMRAAINAIRASSETKNNGLEIKDGKVYQNKNGELAEVESVKSPADIKKIQDMLQLRDIKNKLVSAQIQGMSRQTIDGLRKSLNSNYDAFVKKNGYLNDPANIKILQEDPDSFSILSLENYKAKEGKKPASATKSDIFTKDTVARVEKATKAQSAKEALIVTINEVGYVDAQRIGELLGISEEKARAELISKRLAFKDRSGALIQAEKYLTGKVRAKLDEAKALAAVDESYQANVEALEEVIPADIPAKDIAINLGAAWVPTEVYEAFVRHILQTPYSGELKVNRLKMTNAYSTKIDARFKSASSVYNERTWGAGGWSFIKIFDKIMNGSSMQVVKTEKIGDEIIKSVDRGATAAVNAKVEEINTAFINWLANNDEMHQKLARLYNDTFNDLVEPRYNGDNLTIEGANPMLPLKKHQKDVIQRAIQQGGNLLIAHGVGAGKTAEMAGIAMKMRQLGIIRKPMFVVPKPVAAQWGKEFNKFFPAAKLLVPAESDYGTSGRKTYINKIVSNDYDAVIMSYEMFESIPLSPAAQKAFFEEQMDEAIEALKEMKAEKDAENTGYSRRSSGKTNHSVKQMEKYIEQIKVRIEKLDSKNARDVDNVDFELLGVDGLFVDEAHNFKNLRVSTHLQNVAGINTASESGRAFDLLSKVRYLQSVNDGRGIVFATATPVMNTMGELFVMQKYLAPELMKDRGIYNFDAWAKQFGRVTNELQLNTTGTGYNVKSILSRYNNLPELQTLTRSWSDILTKVEGLKVPDIKGGAPVIHEIEPSDFQMAYVKELAERAEALRGKKVEKGGDNMLVITNNGRDIALSQKMIDANLPLEHGGKMDTVANTICDIWKNEKTNKGTQLIFLDRGTPSNASDMYSQLKQLLMAKGIPAGEIKSIYDAANDKEKLRLFEQVNNGDVRVLIGSTATMGTGVNVQYRVAAMHHVDVPWRPGDMTQRDGRGIRQGNIYADLGGVGLHYYVTKKTFDAYMWQKIQTKAAFINQIMSGTNTMRESEGEGMELTAAEVTAIASGNPMVKEKFALEKDIDRLVSQKKQFDKDRKDNLTRKAHNTNAAEDARRRAALLEREIPNRADISGDKFKITINGRTFTEREKAGAKLISDYIALNPSVPVNIGNIAGLTIRALPMHFLSIGDVASLSVEINLQSAAGTIARIENAINGMEAAVEKLTANADRLDQENRELAELVKKGFEKQDELDQKSARYAEIMRELAPSANESADAILESLASEEGVDYSLRRISSPDFLQTEDKLEDRQALLSALEDAQYSDRDPSRLTAREQLSSAFESITKTDIDKQIIEQYKGKLEKVEADVQALREINAKIKELSFAPGKRDMDELTKLKNNKVTLSNRIARTDSMLTRIENAQPMRQLIAHEKKKAENAIRTQEAQRMAEYRERMEGKVKEAKEKGKESLEKYKGKVSDRSFRAAIKEIAEELTTWINNPDKNARVPQVLRRVIGDFLLSLNLQSKRAISGGDSTKADRELYERMNTLALTLNNINAFQNGEKVVEGMYQEIAGFFDMPAGFQQTLGEMVENIRKLLEDSSGDYVINRMAGEELEQLHYILKILRKSVTQMNKLLSNAAFEHVDTLGNRTIAEMELIKRDNKKNGTAYRFFNWENTMPVYAFDRFGTGGKAVFEALQNGADRLSMIAAEIKNYAEKTFTAKESRDWADELHTFNLDGEQVKMTTWHLMGLYSMSQREQAKGHLYGEGIRVGNFQHKGQTISSKGHTLTPAKVQAMIAQLTARQKDVADKLQRFMNDRGGELGNQVTMVRFGVDMYEEQQYYPLESDKAHLASDTEGPEAGGLYRLLNLSFSKKLQKKANNRVMLYSMIDVFANHMSDMAQYNALALPVLDAVKWLNYQESITTDGQKLTDSVKDVMRDAFGDAANSYITHLLRDINGTRMTGDENAFAMKRLRAFNRAQVAANLRVALLQPLSIVRAGMVLSPGSITKGMLKNVAMLKKNMAEMDKYAGIAQWKQLGFYDVNLSRSMQSIIKQDDTLGERIADKSMWLPQQMDRITWAAIWQASKDKTSSMEEAAKLFRDTIYRTQVVDSILTRSDYMRNSSFLHKWTSSFMSEPTLSYNIVMSSAHSYADDLAKGMKKADAWQKHGKKIARAVTVYAANAIVVTLMQSLMSAWRDDDDYSTFGQKFAEGFKSAGFDNLNALNLPLVNEMWEGGKRIIAKIFPESGIYGFDNESVITAFLDYFVDAVDVFAKHINGDKTSTTLWGGAYKLLQGLSVMTGFPMASATREVTSVWNNTVAEYAPSMKVLTYTGGKYQGYENLYKALQADNEDRIEQLRNTLAMRGADSKTVYGGLRDVVKEQFIAGKITEQDAIDLLKDEEGSPKNENDVYWLVQKWKEGGDAGYSKFDKMAASVMTGTGLKEAMQELLKNGTAKSAISKAITDTYKDQYIETYKRSKSEAASLKARLLNAYVMLGYDRNDKSKDIDAWLKQK